MRDFLESLLEVQMPLLFIVVLRLAVGGGFVLQGYNKVHNEYLKPVDQAEPEKGSALADKVYKWKDHRSTVWGRDGTPEREVVMFGWYRKFLDEAVLKNVHVFSVLLTVGELAVGALLILGLLVRAASVVGIVLCLNYLFATWHFLFPYPQFNILCLVAFVVLLAGSAGRCLGIDAVLHDRFPEIPIF